jgi:hypothetical protein
VVLIPIIQNEGDGEENFLYLLTKEKRTLQGRSCYFGFTLQSVRKDDQGRVAKFAHHWRRLHLNFYSHWQMHEPPHNICQPTIGVVDSGQPFHFLISECTMTLYSLKGEHLNQAWFNAARSPLFLSKPQTC